MCKGKNNTYRPAAGTRCLISGPCCDNDEGYVYNEFEILWANDVFVLYGKKDCWPNLWKWEHISVKPIDLPCDQI